MCPHIKIDADIPFAQRHPERPSSSEVLSSVAEAYGLDEGDVFDRRQHREAYQTSVFLLRRICNMSLKEVAALAGISPGRVSQIQKMMGDKNLPEPLNNYKV